MVFSLHESERLFVHDKTTFCRDDRTYVFGQSAVKDNRRIKQRDFERGRAMRAPTILLILKLYYVETVL